MVNAIEDGSVFILAKDNQETYASLRAFIEENNHEVWVELV